MLYFEEVQSETGQFLLDLSVFTDKQYKKAEEDRPVSVSSLLIR
jgi:hypothetical protein